MKRVWALDVLECNFSGYVQGIGGIVQATLGMYRLRVLAPGRRFVESTPVMRLESSGRPDSRESTPPDSRPGLHNRSQGDIGAAPGGFELPTFNPCARELRKSFRVHMSQCAWKYAAALSGERLLAGCAGLKRASRSSLDVHQLAVGARNSVDLNIDRGCVSGLAPAYMTFPFVLRG